ncbi:hypothetical protein ACE3JD_25060, partial [Enterobacter hormaechei subsp. steigerwaltii]
MKKILYSALLVFIMLSSSARAEVNPACPDANVFSKVFTQICWDCFLDSLNLFGIGKKPNGANSSVLACTCMDEL